MPSATADALPRLRDDLVFVTQPTRGGITTVVKDPRAGKFFRFGDAELFIARQFDGATPVDEVRKRTEARFGAALTSAALETFAGALRRAGLFTAGGDPPRRKPRFHGSLLRMQVRAFDPDRLFTRMMPFVEWCFSPAALAAAAIATLVAAVTAVSAWGEIAAESLSLWRLSAVPLIAATAFVGLSAHEFAHGLTCKRFGGEVHEVGFMLIYLQPALYCDVSDAWLIPERWKRVAVSLAGPVIDLVLWSVAMLAWRVTETDTALHGLALLVMVPIGAHMLLNLSPFLKLDGYYALSDALGIPNLRRRAFAYAGGAVKRLIGIDAPAPEGYSARERAVFLVYGVIASAGTFALLALVIISAGGSVIEGKQPLLMIASTALIGIRFRRKFRRLFGGTKAVDDGDEDDGGIVAPEAHVDAATTAPPASEAPAEDATNETTAPRKRSRRSRYWRRRAWWLAAGCALLLFGAFGHAELRVAGTFSILPEHNADVRSGVDGVVDEVLVTEGDVVRAGDVVARLSSRETRSQLQAVKADIARSEAQLRLLRAGPLPESITLAREVVTRLTDALRYAEARLTRVDALAQRGMITPAELEMAQEGADRARHDLGEAKQRLNVLIAGPRPEEVEVARAELARLGAQEQLLSSQLVLNEVRSPASGTVATPARELRELRGQAVGKGTLIAKVYELRMLDVEIAVAEKDIGDVRVGHRVLLRARAYPGRNFDGSVVAISPAVTGSVRSARDDTPSQQTTTTASTTTRTVVVRTRIDNSELLLKPGMTGQAKILCGDRPVRSLVERRLLRTMNLAVWAWW